MRKVTYYINDLEWFRNDLTNHNPELTLKQIEDILNNMSPTFTAVYSLIGESQPERYELQIAFGDAELEKTNTNSDRLNGYHRMILNDCWRHYMGQEHSRNDVLEGYPKEEVFGCIEVLEEEVDG